MKGLLVDDDELYARTLQRSLARKGIETEIALDAASALARVSCARTGVSIRRAARTEGEGVRAIGSEKLAKTGS